jgi:S-formylglutathione hydrolase FrmB
MKTGLVKILSLYLLIIALKCSAATVDTVLTYSAAMRKNIKAVVVRPQDYSTDKKFPVIYLLHGYSGNYADWVTNDPDKTDVKQLSDRYDVIFIGVDGDYSSWYFDSPIDPAWKYETYVSSELVKYVDSHYSTIDNRSGRAITGLSMGGHGALFLAFRHQDVYGACGSMSGGVDLRPFADNWDIAKRLGTLKEHPDRWAAYSVINLVGLLKPNSLAITFDCGSSDFFSGVNKALHEKLLAAKIPHDYASRPGAHTWEYWGNSINYQLLFFSRFFTKAYSNDAVKQ